MRRSILLLLLGASLSGCAADAGPPDFFLFEPGNSWTYTLIQGGSGEEWTLRTRDASENPDSSRGDLWFQLTRPEPSNDPQNPGGVIDFPVRSFNITQEPDPTGEQSTPIGYTYRFVGQGEGDRNEFFVKYPGRDEAFTENWSYQVENELGTNRFEYDVTVSRSTDPVETGYGSWSDNLLIHRVVTIVNVDDQGNEVPLEQTHDEVWAAGGGLVRYRFQSADEVVTEAVVRTSTAFGAAR